MVPLRLSCCCLREPKVLPLPGNTCDHPLQLCQVLDAAEFCRNVHVDEEWRRQAQQVGSSTISAGGTHNQACHTAGLSPNSMQAPCCGPGLLAVASILLLWRILLCVRCQALARVTYQCVFCRSVWS
jgi:hypothetical protein